MSEGGGPKLVLLGGGTGSFALLPGLKKLTTNVTAIVSMSDDGSSTGVLRDELGVLPPGDVRQCLAALSNIPEVRDLFSYRFSKGRLKGHSLGNIIIAGLELQYDNFEEAIRVAGELLNITGRVVPVTLERHRLMMRDGWRTIRGEGRIDHYAIKRPNPKVWLEPEARINPAARQAIMDADMVVIAPGSIYTSLLALFLVEGVSEAMRQTRARIVSVTNLVNEHGQTRDWHVTDYVRKLESYLGPGVIDVALYNNQPITDKLLKRYAAEGEYPVRIDPEGFVGVHARTIGARLVSRDIIHQDPADTAARRAFIRHDADAVCEQLQKLLVVGAEHPPEAVDNLAAEGALVDG